VTVRSSIDCLIAAMAIRHGIPVMHRDRDFAYLASVSDLKQIAV
jgi:predicted nucleic acid-binding protein